MSELHYAVRNLTRHRGFTCVSILTLALGIAANTVIFSIFDSVLLRPLTFREPGQLVALQEDVRTLGRLGPLVPMNAQHFLEFRRNSHSFDSMGLIAGTTFNLTSDGDPERVPGGRVSSSVFPLLGITPQLGRAFLESEDEDGRDQVAVITDGLWTRRFHRDRTIIGRKILLNGNPYEIVGVLPAQPLVPRSLSEYSAIEQERIERNRYIMFYGKGLPRIPA